MSQISDDEALSIAARKILQDGGSAANLLENNIPPGICLEVGLDTSDLREAGYKAKHLQTDEITASDAKDGGYTADEIREGYSADEVEGAYGSEDFFPDEVENATAVLADLSGKVELNQSAVDEVSEVASSARETIQQLAGELRTAINDLNQQLDQAEQNLEQDITTSTQNLEDLSAKVGELETAVDTSVSGISTQMNDAEARCDEAEEALQQGLTSIQTEQESLTTFLGTFQQTANSLIDEETSRLEAFTSKAGELGGTITSLQENAATEFKTLEGTLGDRLVAAQQGFDEFNEFFTSARDATLGAVTDGTVSKLADFQSQYLEQIVGTVDGSVEVANGALQTFAAVGEGCRDLLDGEIGEVIDTVNGMVETIEPVIDVLEIANDIL